MITGEFDRTCTPRAARETAEGIPNAELVVIPGVGHMSFMEKPDAYNRAVRTFFERTR